jgi:hypothetical protein
MNIEIRKFPASGLPPPSREPTLPRTRPLLLTSRLYFRRRQFLPHAALITLSCARSAEPADGRPREGIIVEGQTTPAAVYPEPAVAGAVSRELTVTDDGGAMLSRGERAALTQQPSILRVGPDAVVQFASKAIASPASNVRHNVDGSAVTVTLSDSALPAPSRAPLSPSR